MSETRELRKAMWTASGILGLVAVGLVAVVGMLRAPARTGAPTVALQPAVSEWPTHELAKRLRTQDTRFSPLSLDDVLAAHARGTRTLRAGYQPLPTPQTDVHLLALDYLRRRARLYPQTAPDLGEHVHPIASVAPTFESLTEEVLIASDVLSHLDSTALQPADAHEQTDVAWLRRQCEAVMTPAKREWTIRWLLDAPVPMVFLTHFACCDEEARARDAVRFLQNITLEIDGLVVPPLRDRRFLVELVAQRVGEHAEFVRGVPECFPLASADTVAALNSAASQCAAALEGVVTRLPYDFVEPARQRIGIGPREYAAVLHGMGVREAPAELFIHAQNDLVVALEVLDEIGDVDVDEETVPAADLVATDAAAHMQVLVPAASFTVAGIANDPGTRFAPTPSGWPDGFAYLLAPLPGVDAPSIVFTNALGGELDPDPQVRAFEGRALRHVLAHESYPGHHVHHLFERDNCALRRVHASPLSAEGWAVHCVSLLHESGATPADRIDACNLAQDRANRAFFAMIDVAVNCLGLSATEIEEWRVPFDLLCDVEPLVEWAEEYPGQLVAYFVGPREVAELERLAAARGADLREFRARFLAAGGIAPWLLESELLR